MPPTNATAEEIAAELREAVANGPEAASKTMGARYAEKVQVAHDPAIPQDGIHDRALLLENGSAEIDAFRRAMPDFTYEGTVTVDGNAITAAVAMSGTLADGTPVRVSVPTVYTVDGGEIVGMTAKIDPDMVATLTKILMSAGFEIPEG